MISKTKKLIIHNIWYVLLTMTCIGQDQQVTTFISPRSQTCNAERMLAGWENVIHQPERYGCYGALAFTIEATSSFRPERINQCLFGDDIITRDCNQTEWNNVLMISGSQTENRVRNSIR